MRELMVVLSLVFTTSVWALQVGDRVPDLAVPSTSGDNIRLTDYAGSWVVLYFYPKAFTPGCTAQACSLRDEYGAFAERGAVILGVSVDPVARLDEFKDEHALPFVLLSDENGELSRAFDSLTAGSRTSARKTFIIDPDGQVAHRFDQPTTRNHADEVLQVLDRLMRE